jgi:hypothetical protein
MAQSRSGVKIDIHLFNTLCCFSCCQHTAAVVTDLATGRKFDIEFPIADLTVYRVSDKTPVEEKASSGCTRTVTLYSAKGFDEFVSKYTDDFANKNYDCCSSNCADAVRFAIDNLCPDRPEVDASCTVYKALCCWGFIPSLGMKCFPSIFCTTPSDTFDLAFMLSCTHYGTEPEAISEYKMPPGPPEISSTTPLLSDTDNVSIAVVTSGNGPSLLATPISPRKTAVTTTPSVTPSAPSLN